MSEKVTAQAAAPTLEDRVKALEEGFKELKQELSLSNARVDALISGRLEVTTYQPATMPFPTAKRVRQG